MQYDEETATVCTSLPWVRVQTTYVTSTETRAWESETFISDMTLEDFSNLSEPQFPHLKNGNNTTALPEIV